MDVKKRLFAAALLVALAAAGSLISGGHNVAKAGPGATPVTIVSPLPLPTTGTATVSGTVGATQSGPWSVNVANSPAVNLAGTPTVNANVTFPTSQGVTVAAAGPLTNVGRLPSNQVMLVNIAAAICPSGWNQVASNGPVSCFDMANHPGEVLVITDFSWVGSTNPGATCTLGIGNSSFGANNFVSAAASGSDGFAAKSEHLTTGITLTVTPIVRTPTFGLPCNLFLASLTGYLMPNQ